MHKIECLRTCNSSLDISIFTYDTFLERIEPINYHYCQIIVILQKFEPLGLCRCQKYNIVCIKMEKNTFNNYLRVKVTSNHKTMDITGFPSPPKKWSPPEVCSPFHEGYGG